MSIKKTTDIVRARADAQRRLRRQHQARRLHALGARAVFEVLDELARVHPDLDIDRRLERFAALDPRILRAVGGDHFPAPPLRLMPK